tara:strand:- start:652 stop:2181 length:1530 start_codon:yes stop_codon:yes gene_type:complete
MQINKVFRPLVNRFIKVNNYEKMKSILDIGFSGVEMIEKYGIYNQDFEGSKKFREEIQMLNMNIERIKKEYSIEKEEIQKKYELKYANLEELTNEINNEKQKIQFSFQTKLDEQRNQIEKEYIEKTTEKEKQLESVKRELDEYRMKTGEENMKRADENYKKLQNIIDKFDNKMEEYRKDKEEQIKILRETINRQYNDSRENLKTELEKLKAEKDKIINELKEENKEFKNKYEKLEVNSVLKGKPYEDAIENELKEIFEKNNNNFTIKRQTNKTGKGDFIVTNYYSKVRIMLEAKNMAKVSSTAKDQQPKFYNDLKNKTNNYQGGIIISSGLIEGKKDYSFEILDDGKIVCFIENYNLNGAKNINMIISVMHDLILYNKTNPNTKLKEILNIFIKNYNNQCDVLKHSKKTYELQDKQVKELKEQIFRLFDIDADEHISQKKTSEDNLILEIKREVEEYIKKEIQDNSNIKITYLKKKIYSKYDEYIKLYKTDKTNGISKKMIDTLIKKYI